MDFEDCARTLGIRVIHEEPPGGRWGCYLHRTRTIYLHPDLSPMQRQYVLGHELAHAHYGHTDCRPQWEEEADALAAQWMVRLCEWQTATQVHTTVEGVADELGVHPEVVRNYAKYIRGFTD